MFIDRYAEKQIRSLQEKNRISGRAEDENSKSGPQDPKEAGTNSQISKREGDDPCTFNSMKIL